MVDFSKRLPKRVLAKPLDPIEIYDGLDRASDKGPLRPAQATILEDWHAHRRAERDTVIKLHTGQGKTLIGLLILQSKLNEDLGPALYLCANNFLVSQTASQAEQFGFHHVTTGDDLPAEFIDSKAILITSVQKLFNGLTKFGLGPRSERVGTLVMDDAHTCIEAIRDSCVIRLDHQHQAYTDILSLFGPDLEYQGAGSYADIKQKRYEAFLPVPYWTWMDKASTVAEILSPYSVSDDGVRFAWPLLKDMLDRCLCIIGGTQLEISPHLPPLHMFVSYHQARHRFFMSATVTNDAFLVKGLGLSAQTITHPLVDPTEKWSGEKMILVPSLIHSSLDRAKIVEAFAKPVQGRKSGMVVLTPSFARCKDWEAYGATVASKTDIDERVEQLVKGNCDRTLVLANRYDGIDLPDNACRVLILDSAPFSERFVDRYTENSRPNSEIIATRRARIIEQGLGRSVRGEKDYCVIILIGPDLIKDIRTHRSRTYFSPQTRMQIEISLELAEFAKEDGDESEPLRGLVKLGNQCLRRDGGWKEFYTQRMNEIAPVPTDTRILDVFSMEMVAELQCQEGAPEKAIATLQRLIDTLMADALDKGWYLQEMGRYALALSKSRSNTFQVEAHRLNHLLLKPMHGMEVARVALTGQKRIENLIQWISGFESFDELSLTLDDMLGSLRFGIDADRFEKALHELGIGLGFGCQRPDKEWKEGPDNLWALRDDDYLLVECKSEVSLTRDFINKQETGQMNNACAWFKNNYKGVRSKNIMIIPTKRVGSGGGFNEPVEIVREHHLKALVNRVRAFFLEFSSLDLQDLSPQAVQKFLELHGLTVDSLLIGYSDKPILL
jgi:replicative superfamily II helicase